MGVETEDPARDDPRVERLLAAIAPDQPAGEVDLESADQRALERALEELSAGGLVTDDEGASRAKSRNDSWSEIHTHAQNILSDEVKDFKVLSRFIASAFHVEGFSGLAVALRVLDGVIAMYWETAAPKRLKGRRNAIEWANGQLVGSAAATTVVGRPIMDAKLTAEDVAAYRSCIKWAQGASARLTEILGDDEGGRWLRVLVNRLNDRSGEIDALEKAFTPAPVAEADGAKDAAPAPETAAADPPQPEPPSSMEADTASDPAPSPSPAPAAAAMAPDPGMPTPDIGDPTDLTAACGSLADAVSSWAAAVAPHAPLDARLFMARRLSSWATISRAPTASGGSTKLAPPADRTREQLQLFFDTTEPEAVLARAEGLAIDNPFWLDAQRCVCQLLERIGAPASAARIAIVGMLGTFLKLHPTLVALKFSDGTPFADATTQDWIKNDVLGADGAEAADPIGEALSVARKDWPTRDVAALDALADGARSASGRERLRWELAEAEFCLSIGRHDLVRQRMTHTDKLIQSLNLEDWDPALATKALTLYVEALPAAKPSARGADDDPTATLRADLIARLSRLDLQKALSLSA